MRKMVGAVFAVIVIGLAIGITLRFIHSRVELKVASLKQRSSGFEADPDSLSHLAAMKGGAVDSALLSIAEDVDTNPVVRVQALAYLSRRETMCDQSVALMLQPQESLQLRKAIIEYLLSKGCSKECLRLVLHYKERQFYGEIGAEQLVLPLVDQQTQAQIRAEVDDLNRKVTSVLVQKPELTAGLLAGTYGLGGALPSRFAIDLARTLPSSSVCRLLVQSSQEIRDAGESIDSHLAESVEVVINQHCVSPTRG